MSTTFYAILQRFGEAGDKTGWTYIDIPEEFSEQISPGVRKSYRVKGSLDKHPIGQVAIMPSKGGGFIMAINEAMRKGISKPVGEQIRVSLDLDRQELTPPAELMEALADLTDAAERYHTLSQAERHYFTRWIDSAKGAETKARRIAQTINALETGLHFGPMLRKIKAEAALFKR